ncbi:MAG: hypothetical protein PHH37_11270 [Paludibacter sp.]|nr:hypothetical protein [Paludibacter sp.]
MLAKVLFNDKLMKYNYSIDINNKIIFVNVTGSIYESDASEIGLLLRQKAQEMRYSLIFNLVETDNNISMGSAYFWFEKYYDRINDKLRFIPTAYITHKNQGSYYNFIQTICLNHGIKTRIFDNEEAAINWLKKNNH